MFNWFIGCVAAVAIVATIIGGIVYGAITTNEQYYNAQKMCIEAGGSWIATPSGTSNATQCLRLK